MESCGIKWNWHIVWEVAIAIWGSAYSVVASHVCNVDVIGVMYVDWSLYRIGRTCE